jgi:hypothetical protein
LGTSGRDPVAGSGARAPAAGPADPLVTADAIIVDPGELKITIID